MVKYKNIIRAIENYVIKCPTIAQMKAKLGQMTYEEVLDQLKEQDLLNPLEEKEYKWEMGHHNTYTKLREGGNDLSSFGERSLANADETLFQYGRRLFEGLKRSEAPVFDKGSFNEDKQFKSITDLTHELGDIEKKQAIKQEEVLNRNTFDSNHWIDLNDYFSGDTNNINKEIYDREKVFSRGYGKKLSDETRKRMKNIDEMMGRTTGFDEGTVLYRGGSIDIHLNVGDHSVWKGYTSTTFQKKVSESYMSDHIGSFMYVIRCPKGTKGIVGNAETPYNGSAEHEYVLPRNTGYTVTDIDYDNRVIEILLDEP